MQPSHIYPGAHSLSAYITIQWCNIAIEFYKKAFWAQEIGRITMPDGSIAHAEIQIEGSLLMLAEENTEWGNLSPTTIGGNPITLWLYVKDVETTFQQALDAGATEIMPIADQFYGDRSGTIMDPYGYKWSIATHTKDVSFTDMQKKSDEMFEMDM